MDYNKLAQVYQELEKTSRRLKKTEILSNFLKKAKKDDFKYIMYLLQGRVFPPWDERKIGMSSKLMLRVIAKSSGVSVNNVEAKWRKIGDLGEVAEELIKTKTQRTLHFSKLSVEKVFNNIAKLAELQGKGTVDKKINLISELLSNANALEAKYITRTILETLRIGVADGTIRDSIAKAFDRKVENVEKAFEASDDFAKVVVAAKEKKLKKVGMEVGVPIKLMLALRENSIEDVFKRVGDKVQIEDKLDGCRLQVHKKGDEIKLFTRNLENVTDQFQDVVKFVRENVKGWEFIIEGEAVGYDIKTKKYIPFQNISQRIKRKYSIDKLMNEVPVELNLFDVVYYNGKNLLNEEFIKRRRLLEKIVKNKKWSIKVVSGKIVNSVKEAEKFQARALAKGMEGVMFKKLDAFYKPGRRVGHMIKLKWEAETLDLVITGAIWGEGKRANVLSSFELSCKDRNEYKTIGRVGTGIKEKAEGVTFSQLTKMLKPLIIKEKGKYIKVKPKIIVEVGYQEIQKSPSYSSGFGLRFPRVIRLRTGDKDEPDTLNRINRIYKKQ